MKWDPFVKNIGLCLMLSVCALAQSSTGSISGVVQDQSAAAMPGAKVTITDTDTGTVRSAVADAGGRYSIPNLFPDHYDVQAEMSGFSTEIRRGIQLTVGSTLEINMSLRVGQAAEKIEVTTEAPLVETLTGSISGLVDDQEIRDLPLNARTLDQLISLESSAPIFRNGNHALPSGAELTYIVHGGRDQMNQFLLDGMEMLGAYNFGTQPGGALGYNEGIDAVREFQVLTSNASAAFGKKAGAYVNMASKTGTNQIHGSAFEFLRNSALDARNFFDHQIPPFRRNQYGASAGGPIKKDRTFFFFSYEGLKQSLGLSVVETVPNSNARQGFLPCAIAPTLTCNTSTGLANVGVVPTVAPFLVLFPPANGLDFGNGTAQSVFSPQQISSQDFYLGRVDHRISDKDSIFFRYNSSPANTHTVSPYIYQATNDTSQLHMATIQETRVLSPTTVNTLRVGITRPTSDIARPYLDLPTNLTGLTFIPTAPALGAAFGSPSAAVGILNFALSATGAGSGVTLGSINSTGSTPFLSPSEITQWTFADDIVRQQGPHSLHIGFEIQPNTQENLNSVPNLGGVMTFANLTSLLQGTPSAFAGPNPALTIDGTKSYRQTYMAAYIQDDFKVRRNLTLNLGVRWEFLTPPRETHGRISNYHAQRINGIPTLDALPTLGSPVYASHYNNFAPRLGFAWDVFGDGKMSVRGGFGMYFDQIEDIFKSFNNVPFTQTLQVSNPPFPFGFSGTLVPPLPTVTVLAQDMKVPTRDQFNLSVQRQFGNTVFTIAYVGSEAYHLTRKGDLNEVVPQFVPGAAPGSIGSYFFSPTGQRAQPGLASSNYLSTDATSSYQGIDLSASQRLANGLRYKVGFTWSKTIDSASAIIPGLALGNTTFVMEENNLALDRGLSAFDTRRNVVGNLTYDLPWQKSGNTLAKWVGGWQVGAIATIQDGFPFTILTGFNRSGNKENTTSDRPNYATGATSVPILGGPGRYFDPTVFALPAAGFYGDIGRNTVIGPGLVTLDANVTKVFPIRERVKLNFRAEFFNLLNRANFALPANQIFTSTGGLNATAGSISSTVTTSRQLQFGLKLIF